MRIIGYIRNPRAAFAITGLLVLPACGSDVAGPPPSDSSQIAFMSSGGLYTMKSDGKGRTFLTNDGIEDSPTGRQITDASFSVGRCARLRRMILYDLP